MSHQLCHWPFLSCTHLFLASAEGLFESLYFFVSIMKFKNLGSGIHWDLKAPSPCLCCRTSISSVVAAPTSDMSSAVSHPFSLFKSCSALSCSAKLLLYFPQNVSSSPSSLMMTHCPWRVVGSEHLCISSLYKDDNQQLILLNFCEFHNFCCSL